MNNGRDCQHGRQVGKCDSCDLIEAEKEIKQLCNELWQQKLVHIGFTNDHQVRYATEEKSEAAFYPDSDNECYIPVYMLDIHDHRVGSESVIYCENIARKKKIADLTRQNSALMAKVALLDALVVSMQERACLFLQPDGESEGDFTLFIIEALDGPAQRAAQSPPAQCLAEVKAQAVDESADELNRTLFEKEIKNKGWAADFITINNKFYAYTDPEIDNMWLGWQAALKKVKVKANQLRQQAKGGE